MLPGRVGPARKILTYLKREQQEYKDTLQQPSREALVIDSNVSLGSTSSSKPNQPSQRAQVDDSNEASGSTSCRETCQPICSNSVSITSMESPKQKSLLLNDLSIFVPTYSPHFESLLQRGEVFKDWDKFIEETAYFIISRPEKFESRGIYEDFGRLMYQKYKCIGHSSFGNPWGYFNKKLSQKIRNIRWRLNARGKSTPTGKKRKLDLPEIAQPAEIISMSEASKVFKEQLGKPKKDMDHALIMKSLRGSFKERRNYVEKKHNGSVKELVFKFPILGKAEYVEKEFFLMRPNFKKNKLMNNWTDTFAKLDTIIGKDQDEDEDAPVGFSEELKLIRRLEEKLKGRQGGQLLSFVKVCVPKGDEAPRIVFVTADKRIIDAYIFAEGIKMEVPTDLKEVLVMLLFSYYVWDLTYPRQYQLLGFLQVYIIGDKQNKFFMNPNYSKFVKIFDDLE